MQSKESMSLSKDSEPHEIMLQLPRLRTKRFSILNKHPQTENREDHEERIGTALEGPKAPTTPKIALTVPGKMIIKLTGSLFQSALTLFSCVMYVISTYSNKGSTFMVTIEYAVAGLFATDYFWGFIIAKDKRAFMLNPLNLVDLVTIFPVLLNILSVRII